METEKLYDLLSKMPALKHHQEGTAIIPENSEALKWITSLPGFWSWAWHRLLNSKRLKYDRATGTWSGVPRGKRGPKPGATRKNPSGEYHPRTAKAIQRQNRRQKFEEAYFMQTGDASVLTVRPARRKILEAERATRIRAEIPMNDAAAPRVIVPEPMGMPVVTSSSAAEDLDA